MRYLARLVAALPLLTGSVAAAVGGPWSFTVRIENDLPANADRYYTNGISFSYSHCVDDRDAFWPAVLQLPGLDHPGLLANGFDFGQVMVTPADTARMPPDPRDRPYAGLLFIGVSWQRQGDRDYAALKLITGVVGPASFAEQTLIRGIGALPPARDAAPWGLHLFAGAGGLAVARNLTLDGSSFRSGPDIDRRPFIAAVEAGAVMRGRGWQLAASWVVWGREFETQVRHSEFGAVAFTVFR